MDLKPRMALAGHSLLAMLNPDAQFLPTDGFEPAHDLGRWWDAVLRLEEAIGFLIPAELEAASLRNLQQLTDNPDGILLKPGDAGINPPEPLSRISERLAKVKAAVPDLKVVIRADRRVPFSAVRALMQVVADNQIERMNLVALSGELE